MLINTSSRLLLTFGSVILTTAALSFRSVEAATPVIPNQQQAGTNLIAQGDNPYSKLGYQGTAFFKCSVGNPSHNQMCPGGINRHGNGKASITVKFINGYEVQYDFANGNVTTTFGGKLDWGKSGDEWYIGIDENLFIIIPDAAVNGG
jgi:hypothetical protein